MTKPETKRISIYTTKDIADNLATLSREYGVSASSLASLAIGQYVQGMMKQREMLYGSQGIIEELMLHLKEHVTQQISKEKENTGH